MKRHGFTIWEALIVLIILGIIAAILFPIFSRAREPHRHPSCQSNLKQIALGFKQYIQDFDERYPIAKNSNSGLTSPSNWAGQLGPYLKSVQLFQCHMDKSATGPQKSSYGYNARLSKINETSIKNSALIVLNYEVTADPNGRTQTGITPSAGAAAIRHLDGANYSFVDGHVKWFKPGKVTVLPVGEGVPTFLLEEK